MNVNNPNTTQDKQPYSEQTCFVYYNKDQLGPELTNVVTSELIRIVPLLQANTYYFWSQARQHIKTKLQIDCVDAFLRSLYEPFNAIEKIADTILNMIKKCGTEDWGAICKQTKLHTKSKSVSTPRLQKWYEIRGHQLAGSTVITKTSNTISPITSELNLSACQTRKSTLNTAGNTSFNTRQTAIQRVHDQFDLRIAGTSSNYSSTLPITTLTTVPQELYNINSTITTPTVTTEPLLNSEIPPLETPFLPYDPFNSDWMLGCEKDLISNTNELDVPADETPITTQNTLHKETLLEGSSIPWDTVLSPVTIEFLNTTLSETPMDENISASTLQLPQRKRKKPCRISDNAKKEALELKKKHPNLSFEQITKIINTGKDEDHSITSKALRKWHSSYIQSQNADILSLDTQSTTTSIHSVLSEQNSITGSPITYELDPLTPETTQLFTATIPEAVVVEIQNTPTPTLPQFKRKKYCKIDSAMGDKIRNLKSCFPKITWEQVAEQLNEGKERDDSITVRAIQDWYTRKYC